MHVDDFIEGIKSDPYASWMLHHFRLPAFLKARFEQFMDNRKLFCTFREKRYRVIGASRMGDIWLTKDFTRDAGYDLRVDVDQCTDWSPQA
jgi:hypothetical protein